VIAKILGIAAFAGSIGCISTAARALDIAPSTPSTQISQTLPSGPRYPSAPITSPEAFANVHPVAGHRGYVFVAPAWRRTTDRNSNIDPGSGADGRADSVPGGQIQKPVEENRR
jgi:hypothetical protein